MQVLFAKKNGITKNNDKKSEEARKPMTNQKAFNQQTPLCKYFTQVE